MRSSFSWSRSTASSPSTVVTSTGKKQISTITTSLGNTPNPHQNTSSGAITAIGTAWEPIASGYTARRSTREKWISTASAKPSASASAIPSPTSVAVGARFAASRPALSHSAAATACGEGST